MARILMTRTFDDNDHIYDFANVKLSLTKWFLGKPREQI